MNNQFYQVAGHSVRLSFSDSVFAAEGLNNYAPFRVEACAEKNAARCLFHLLVVDMLPVLDEFKPIGNFADDIADITVSRFADGGYLFRIAPPNGDTAATMLCNSTFTEAQVALSGNARHHFFGFNNCIMMMYAFATAPLDTLMIHASVVMYGGKGYIFQGKSGTGKSTHSRLWLEHIAGTEPLNDDNSILRVEADGLVRVYGSPWSGKTHCYRNESALLGAIVRLRQAPHNTIRRNSVVQAFAVLKPTCSTMQWDERIHTATCDTVTQVVEKIPTFTLECLPNKAAAQLCFNTVTDGNN